MFYRPDIRRNIKKLCHRGAASEKRMSIFKTIDIKKILKMLNGWGKGVEIDPILMIDERDTLLDQQIYYAAEGTVS
jgi:hypothetical protein